MLVFKLIRAKGHLAAWLVLGCGILGSLFTSVYVRKNIEQTALRQLAFSCEQATLKVQERLNTYAMILRGGSALFAAREAVSRDDWRAYVSTLHADQNVPGVQGIGFAPGHSSRSTLGSSCPNSRRRVSLLYRKTSGRTRHHDIDRLPGALS